MTTLSAAQIKDLRSDIGDTGINPEFAPEELQRFYDRAEDDYPSAVVYALRQRVADPRMYFKNIEEMRVRPMSEVEKQGTFDRLQQLLSRWEAIAGMQGGVIKVGQIHLDLDADDDNSYQWDGTE